MKAKKKPLDSAALAALGVEPAATRARRAGLSPRRCARAASWSRTPRNWWRRCSSEGCSDEPQDPHHRRARRRAPESRHRQVRELRRGPLGRCGRASWCWPRTAARWPHQAAALAGVAHVLHARMPPRTHPLAALLAPQVARSRQGLHACARSLHHLRQGPDAAGRGAAGRRRRSAISWPSRAPRAFAGRCMRATPSSRSRCRPARIVVATVRTASFAPAGGGGNAPLERSHRQCDASLAHALRLAYRRQAPTGRICRRRGASSPAAARWAAQRTSS